MSTSPSPPDPGATPDRAPGPDTTDLSPDAPATQMVGQPASPPTGPSRLRRSSSDKVLAGVCGGLARHTGVEPILFRIGFVALVFAGGTGIFLYLALVVLMPRDDGQPFWSRTAGGWPLRSDRPGAPDIAPETRIGDREREQAVSYLGTAHQEGRLDLAEYEERITTAYQAKTAGDLAALTADLVTGAQLGPTWSAPVFAQARPLSSPGPHSPVPRVTVAILMIGFGIVALGGLLAGWSLDPSSYFAIAVAMVGIALLVTAFGPWQRRKGGLITLGILLSLALLATSAVDGRDGFGEGSFSERTYRPLSVDQVRDSYQVLMGSTTLDLSGLDLTDDRPTEIGIEVTMGNFEIFVPSDADVQINGDASFGSVTAFGDRGELDGSYPGSGDGTEVGDGRPELILELDVRFGNAEVSRVG